MNAPIVFGTIRPMPDEPTNREGTTDHSLDYLRKAEVALYHIVAVLLSITAAAAIASAARMLWTGLVNWTIATETLRVLDQLLIVLMLVEILHTVRISIRSHILLATEPFLVVGLIASIRRVLIISLQMTSLTREGKWSTDGASIFHASMIELALLVILILVLVFSITLLRRYAPAPKELMESMH
ncbi:MAG TPA: phosphate-starvation-inducible PsiE family protein [Candidatus Acidoferrum sp.]|nr:phosphate-starvation-inducible PsiE family protein [Candidatus Acidoferrum sp.]